jgi:hypothetical protein
MNYGPKQFLDVTIVAHTADNATVSPPTLVTVVYVFRHRNVIKSEGASTLEIVRTDGPTIRKPAGRGL